jgi:predicted TIM-barrel fold metal-dependent hydrolase
VFFNVDPTETITLSSVITVLGAGALLFTSDFPHEGNAVRCRQEISTLEQWEGLSAEEKRAMLSDNARLFYRLPG